VIYGGKGADLITGGGGSNVFRFNLRDGLNQGDVITDFRPGADVIRVESVPRNSLAAAAFGGKTSLQSAGAKSAFETVDTLDRSDRSKAVFLYARLTGELAYNGNGSGSGFGRGGGVITSLPVLLAFDPRDLQLAYI
jgi:Ca2+-binding RTX toxin-like protein